MSHTVISVENVSKYYRLGLIGGGTLRADFERWWAQVRGRPNPLLKIGQEDYGNRRGEYIWALRDVSFEVQQGEVLGIIGRNGAGKTEKGEGRGERGRRKREDGFHPPIPILHSPLSIFTEPTEGYAEIHGRVGSLLEVGTGFHPELTGQENISSPCRTSK
jgi:lipopolysaccharide transport system ATP-binding protein